MGGWCHGRYRQKRTKSGVGLVPEPDSESDILTGGYRCMFAHAFQRIRNTLTGGVMSVLPVSLAFADAELSLRPVITDAGQNVYRLQQPLLVICLVIAVAVFATVIYSVSSADISKYLFLRTFLETAATISVAPQSGIK